MIDESKGSGNLPPLSEFEEFNIPSNDNLREIILENIQQFGGDLVHEIEDMFKIKVYRKRIDGFLIHICGSEDIPKYIMKEANEKIAGFVGTDFLINELYRFPSFGLKDSKGYKDPCRIIKDDLPIGYRFKFSGEDNEGKKALELTVLKYHKKPTLCLLGPNDQEYAELKTELRKSGRKIKAVVEKRFLNIAKAFLENEFGDGEYILEDVTRSTEGFIKSNKDEEKRFYDVGIDIGETFSTAKKNGLKEYKKIMQTYLAFVRCIRV